MATEAPTRNIYQKLNSVMAEVGTLPKTGRNTNQNYAFIEQAYMMAVLRPLFVTHGLVILPEIISTDWHQAEGAKQTTARCQMRFTLVNADNPAEKLECLWAAEGADMGDKGVNKAGTSGEKYWLMKMLMLSDKDDPDAESPQEPVRSPTPQPARPQAARPFPPASAIAVKSVQARPPARGVTDATWNAILTGQRVIHSLTGSAPFVPDHFDTEEEGIVALEKLRVAADQARADKKARESDTAAV